MSTGMPGFVGARLKEAREVRRIRANELSEMISVSPQAVSAYENGKKAPSPDVAESMARVLNVPLHFFTLPQRDEPESPLFFRSMSAATKTARTRAAHRQRWLEDVTRYLGKFVEFPQVNLPRFDLPPEPLQISLQDTEDIAEDARKHWNLAPGPVGNMIHLLENNGVIVAIDELEAVTLDSLSRFSDRPYIIIGREKGSAVRWRWDTAHELGHLLLHGQVDHVELARSAEFKTIEDQAHRFAAAFLLPADQFASEFFAASLDALRVMKSKWNVSIQAMLMRAGQLDLLNDELTKRLWINLSRRGWRRVEPLDDVLTPESPKVLRRALELTLREGHSVAEIRQDLALAERDIESLCGLDTGELAKLEQAAVFLRENREATVYEFKRREG